MTDTLGRFLLPIGIASFMNASDATAIGSAIASMLIYILMAAILVVRQPDYSAGKPEMFKESHINLILLIGLLVVPIIALFSDEPFIISLSTKVAIFALAGVGLNIALGFGGLVSFGHAAFFGLGGYAAGILASHALNYEPMFNGHSSFPVLPACRLSGSWHWLLPLLLRCSSAR